MASPHTEYIHFRCSLLLICLKTSIWPDVVILMLFLQYCIYTHMRPPELSWNIYIFYNIIISVNVYICMCRFTITAMSFLGILGLLALGISPWQGSSLAGVEWFMSLTVGTSNGPSRFHQLLGITWASAVIFPEPCVTPLTKILIGRCWAKHVPNLGHLQWPFQFL